MSKESNIRILSRRLIMLFLPLGYYFLSREGILFMSAAILLLVLFIAYLKYYLERKISPGFLSRIFDPETDFSFLAASCFLAIFFFGKIIALNTMLFIILGNTFAEAARVRYGKPTELITFAYSSLAASLFLLFFPLVFDWHVALLGCFAGTVVRWLKFPVNQDLSVGLASGVVMTLLLQ